MNENEEFEFRARREREALTQKEPGFGEKAGAMAYGAATDLAGGFGELEKLGRKGTELIVPQTEYEKAHPLPGGRETIFPTVKEVESGLSKLGIKPPREEVGGYRTAGEVLGMVGTAAPGLVRGLTRGVIGLGTSVSEGLAREAEKLGFKLSPAQVRRAAPVGQKGAAGFAEHNQNLANQLAAKGTGESTNLVSREFIGNRLKDLGKEFDKLYLGKEFKIDRDALDAISSIAEAEAAAPPVAGVSAVRQVANQILDANRELMATPGAKDFRITGEGLQRLRNALTARARSSGRADAHEIYNLVDKIDESIARNHPEVAAKLVELRPMYRNSVILEDLYRAGGIRGGDVDLQMLGNMLRGKSGAVRMAGMDIDRLGELGRELNLVPMTRRAGEGAIADEKTMRALLGSGVDFLATPLRTRAARALQRAEAGRPPPGFFSRVPGTAAAGAAVSPLTSDQEE